ncbi:hypothetical protein LTR84_011198 [Exophiala bonariae]|uniref:Uncharacterized protein n=1 Tax=Exophiala bonariae TaxID=1690606 RepID=A0AAV9NMU5_9EURO|nr:hypothetical protein LTR84_011198 [Exophiala bonariae]
MSLRQRHRLIRSFQHLESPSRGLGSTLHNVDLILLLIAHRLRHNLFKDGSTLHDILHAAFQRGDHVLRWADRTLPIAPDTVKGYPGLVDMKKHGPPVRATNTLEEMSNLAGFLNIIKTEDLRRGENKDTAYIYREVLKGVTTTRDAFDEIEENDMRYDDYLAT